MEQTISSLFNAAESGDDAATDKLFSTLYSELHRMAKREMARRGGGLSLGATTLLHDAYLQIAARDGTKFPDQARFMGYASRVMRSLIIDHARSRHAIKRGGEFEITSLDAEVIENPVDAKELSAISDALDQLAKVEPDLAEFGGPEVLLRVLHRGNCRPSTALRADCSKEVGESPHLSPPQP